MFVRAPLRSSEVLPVIIIVLLLLVSVCPCWPGVIDSDLNQSAEVTPRLLEHSPAAPLPVGGGVVLSSFVLCSSTVITTQLIAHPQWKCHVHYYLHY